MAPVAGVEDVRLLHVCRDEEQGAPASAASAGPAAPESTAPRYQLGRKALATGLLAAGAVVAWAAFSPAARRSAGPSSLELDVGEAYGEYSTLAPAGVYATQAPTGGYATQAAAGGLRTWEEANALAAQTNAKLSSQERIAILSGLGFDAVGHFVGVTTGVPRLGVPPLKMQDASNGFRPLGPNEYGTVTSWPCMLALAATWDPDIVSRVAGGIAEEFAGKGANVLLGPGLNVHRSPFGGRNWEYLPGEDPKLGSVLGQAYVTAVQNLGVMVTAKHFAFNEQENDRDHESSEVSRRTARELYLPPFQAAIDAGAGAIMCSYNRVGKNFACESTVMLKDELRTRMGFQGFVMSDWWAVHGSWALANGLDVEMPSAKFVTPGVMQQNQAATSQAAQHVLASIYHVGLDQNPGCAPPCNAERASNQRSEAHVQLAAEAAAKSIVLLQNNGVLPINPSQTRSLAILGSANLGDTMNTWGPGSPYSGGGSGHVASNSVVTPLNGITQKAAQAGIQVLDDSQASSADLIIIVGTTTAGEGSDRPSLSLDGDVDALISRWSQTKHVVVLLEVPGAVLTPWRGQTAAIACLFAGGEQSGNAFASVLFGDVAPEGRLPVTFPASLNGVVRPGAGTVSYGEEMATGYRSSSMDVAFAFGSGLAYTTFSQSAASTFISGCPQALCASVTVSNSGSAAGREVVQAYIRFDRVDGSNGPRYLRAFQKTGEIQPGSSEAVTLQFSSLDLSTFQVESNDFVQESAFTLFVGSSAASLSSPQYIDLTSL